MATRHALHRSLLGEPGTGPALSEEHGQGAAFEKPSPVAQPEASQALAQGSDTDPRQAPDLPPAGQWQDTRWAGALFWLRALQAPGVLDGLLGPTAGSPTTGTPNTSTPTTGPADPLAQALLAVARALGVPDGDVAQLAFLGGHWPEGGLACQPDEGVVMAAQALVARWAQWLDEAAPDLPAPRLAQVCQRPGRLRLEPGWIELQLPLEQVDTRLRRLGLDLDPGYLPWLGCVLRIRYE
jgi:hypothetical protein